MGREQQHRPAERSDGQQPQSESPSPPSARADPKIGIGKPNVATSWPKKAREMAKREWRLPNIGENRAVVTAV